LMWLIIDNQYYVQHQQIKILTNFNRFTIWKVNF